jgi:predicted ATPase/class 3 adenylate cyclase
VVDLPSGTVTFLFTDIEGSTRLWDEHPEAMRRLLAQHDDLLRACIDAHGGRVFKAMGDAFCAVFPTPSRALRSALAAQQWLPPLTLEAGNQTVSIRVRMAIHTGEVEHRDGDYFGPTLNRVARLLAAGHGGQVLLSAAAREAVGTQLPEGSSLQDRGSHRLKDLQQPEAVFQLCHPLLPAVFPPLRSLSTHPNNLPAQLTTFIGREREMAAVKKLLGRSRLLTLTGAGGTGKTRLTLQVAADLLETYPEGIWVVELAPLTDPALVPQAVATTLAVKEEPGTPLTQTLVERLKSKRLLLLLDNCEHLLDACASLADAILRECVEVQLLASSRERLGMTGEQTYHVPSLGLPPEPEETGELRPEELLGSEAAQLFAERAALVKSDFTVTPANAGFLAQVCCRLDGIPLALELAAARVRVLPVEQLAARLGDRFRLLTGGSRTAVPRQQTLRALIDWSHDLLSEPERALLRRLSVFAGGWTLEAAEAVCAGQPIEEWELLDLLTALVDKSLVVCEETETEARYHLLETIRQYAREKLVETDESVGVSQRHLGFYLSLAEEATPHLYGAEQIAAQKRLQRESDNLRAALEWSLGWEGGVEAALRLVGALGHFWVMGSHLREGEEWATRSLARGRDVPPSVLVWALIAAWKPAFFQGDYGTARSLGEEALQFAREAQDSRAITTALFHVGILAVHLGELEVALASAEEGLPLAQVEGDYCYHRVVLGLVNWMQGNYAGASTFLRESLEISRALDDMWHVGMTLANLGFVTGGEGDWQEASALHREGLSLCQRLEDCRGIAWHLVGMAGVEVSRGRADRSARLLSATAAVLEAIGSCLPPPHLREHDRTLDETRRLLGEEAFAVGWAEGRAMTLEQAVAYALEEDAADGGWG